MMTRSTYRSGIAGILFVIVAACSVMVGFVTRPSGAEDTVIDEAEAIDCWIDTYGDLPDPSFRLLGSTTPKQALDLARMRTSAEPDANGSSPVGVFLDTPEYRLARNNSLSEAVSIVDDGRRSIWRAFAQTRVVAEFVVEIGEDGAWRISEEHVQVPDEVCEGSR